ncbi:MAG: hypothetical protein AAF392_02485 [Bacteroidota bacterium]
MSPKTRLKLRIIAITIALMAVGMQLQFVIIPTINAYTFWFAIGSFILLLVTSQ